MIHQRWSRSRDDPDPEMMLQKWSRSSNDPDPMMMIQIEWWSRSEDEDDLKMQMTRWSREEDQWWKLCRENTFLVKRECWCNCNFGMYSLVFLMYCNPMFILGCTWVMSCPDVPIKRFYNVNKSCQVIVGNPPIDQGINSPQFWGTRVIRLT